MKQAYQDSAYQFDLALQIVQRQMVFESSKKKPVEAATQTRDKEDKQNRGTAEKKSKR